MQKWGVPSLEGTSFTGSPLILLFLITLCFFRTWASSDGIYYVAQTVSIVEDRDLNLYNQPLPCYGKGHLPGYLWSPQGRERTGYVCNCVFLGPSLFWMPSYLLSSYLLRLLEAGGMPPVPTGFNAVNLNAICFTSLAFAWGGLGLCFIVIRERRGTHAALLTTALLGGATPLLAYSTVEPSFSHSFSFFFSSLLLLLWLRYRQLPSLSLAACIGIVAGAGALTRPQNMLLLCPIGGELLWRGWKGETRPAGRWLLDLAVMAIGAGIVFSPQAAYWWITEGKLFGPTDWRFSSFPGRYALQVLFSPRKGLFFWSPALFLAFPGFVYARRRTKGFAFWLLLGVLIQIIMNGSVAQWWGGGGFGARRCVSCLPFFALFVSEVFSRLGTRWRRRASFFVMGFICINVLLLAVYYDNPLGDYETPLRLSSIPGPIALGRSMFHLSLGTFSYGRELGWTRYARFSESAAAGASCCLVLLGVLFLLGFLRRRTGHPTVASLVFSACLLCLGLDALFFLWDAQAERHYELSLIGRWEKHLGPSGWRGHRLDDLDENNLLWAEPLKVALRPTESYAWSVGRLSPLHRLPKSGEQTVHLTHPVRARQVILSVEAAENASPGAWRIAPWSDEPAAVSRVGKSYVQRGLTPILRSAELHLFCLDFDTAVNLAEFTLIWEKASQDVSISGILFVCE